MRPRYHPRVPFLALIRDLEALDRQDEQLKWARYALVFAIGFGLALVAACSLVFWGALQ